MVKTFTSSLISKEDLKQSKRVSKDEVNMKVVWNSKMIEEVNEAIESGEEYPYGSPYLENEVGVRKANINYELSEEEIEEFKKCKKDIVYFALKYCKIKNEKGKVLNIEKLRPYQINFLKAYERGNVDAMYRFLIYMASRQIGKSVMSAIILNHFICFNYEKTILIMANKGSTVDEIITKIRDIYIELPFFIKPGVRVNNVKSMKFDSKNRIIGQTTTKTTAIGFTVDFLYMDEFAHVPENILLKFYKSIYPTISSLVNSRIIITSTPDGYNLFHTLYTMALAGENEYKAFTTYWYEVEGRDEEWKRKEIANLGGNEDVFSQEYDLVFSSSSNTLLDSETLKRLKTCVKKYEHIVIDSFEDENIVYNGLKWDKEYYDNTDFENGKFLLLIDLAKGIGKDYSVINIFEICLKHGKDLEAVENPKSEKDFVYLKQIGMFRDNTKNVKEVAHICHLLCDFFGYDNVKINLEINFDGDFFVNCMEEYDEYYDDLFFHTKHTINAQYEKIGIKITGDNKIYYCNEIKNILRRGYIIINEEETFKEAESFGLNAKGSYSSMGGHDDIFMTLVGLVPSLNSFSYDEIVEEVFSNYDSFETSKVYEKLQMSEKSDYIDYSSMYNSSYYEVVEMSKYKKVKNLSFGY